MIQSSQWDNSPLINFLKWLYEHKEAVAIKLITKLPPSNIIIDEVESTFALLLQFIVYQQIS